MLADPNEVRAQRGRSDRRERRSFYTASALGAAVVFSLGSLKIIFFELKAKVEFRVCGLLECFININIYTYIKW
jgi:hypothetical protein